MNILITGASRGIGRAIALEFAKQLSRSKIIITYNRNYKKALEVGIEIEKNSNNIAIPFKLDVTNRNETKELIAWFTKGYGPIDVLINNAGITMDRTLKKMTDEEWDKVIDVNLTGVFNVTRAVLPFMKEGGCIINITSVIGIVGNFGQTNYAASKAGVIAFTKSLAKELARKQIRVNAVAAGFVNTDMMAGIPEEYKKLILDKILLKRFAEPEEIARLVIWLAIQGTYCTAQTYIIDGGLI